MSKLTEDQRRQINERLQDAKRELMAAERLAIEFGAGIRLQRAIAKLCGETERQQHQIK